MHRSVDSSAIRRGTARRAQGGFTMVEVIVAVAIIAVIMAIAFVGLWQLRINLAQTERDATARELYIAAQNHLTAAHEQGLLKNLGNSEKGTADEARESVRYFAYSPDAAGDVSNPNNPNNPASALSLMLPPGSIDDTVRLGGSYVISYKPASGAVTEVFYSPSGGYAACSFGSGDYGTLTAQGTGYSGAEKSGERQHYKVAGSGDAVIGWYDGSDLGTVERHAAPVLEIVNGDVLKAMVTTTAEQAARINNGTLLLRLEVANARDDALASKTFTVSSTDLVAGSASTYSVVLDDITRASKNFASVFAHPDKGSFVPGEDLKIRAWIVSTSALSNVAASATFTANSLFASNAAAPGKGCKVKISSMRHLENLYNSVSNFDPASFDSANSAVKAVQTADLSWTDFMADVNADTGTCVYYKTEQHGLFGAYTQPGAYLPVNPAYELVYDGGGYKISDVRTSEPTVGNLGNAGLFGTLSTAGSSVKSLLFDNCNISTSSGHAGGLVGSAAASVTIDSCAVSGLVCAAGDAGDAGGLVGNAGSDAVLTIKDSYSAGRTVNGGQYVNANEVDRYANNVLSNAGAAGGLVGSASALSVKYCYSTCSAQGATSVGGLVGAADAGAIENCYATGLVSAAGDSGTETVRGAFAGKLGSEGGKVECDGDEYLGIVNTTMDDSGKEEPLPVVGSESVEGVSPADDAIASYRAFAGSQQQPAYPKDRLLPSIYTYKTIAELHSGLAAQSVGGQDGGQDDVSEPAVTSFRGKTPSMTAASLSPKSPAAAGAADFLSAHYGDWPQPEALIINEPQHNEPAMPAGGE